ncbi:MAG: hypothetical protein WD688_19790 [Candidatus Binatia bacterium]
MSPSSQHTVKVVAGTLLVISLAVGFLERWCAPHALILESSPDFPGWIGRLGLFLATLGTVAYLGVDIVEGRRMRQVPQDGSPGTKERPPVPVDPGPGQERGA